MSRDKKVPLWYFLTHFLEDIKELVSFDIYNVFNFIMNIYKKKSMKVKRRKKIDARIFSRRFNTKLILFVINNEKIVHVTFVKGFILEAFTMNN